VARELISQTALPDPGLAANQEEMSGTGGCTVQQREAELHLAMAADEGTKSHDPLASPLPSTD
jgi:hypothetical protein